ncbi:MAG: hypothetical protein MUD14_20320 [Hydrococcus sp. Prado102]|jgi:hypothetical protein|nr:hypothetical protein [Hydrococcus sp. Prado102]
MTESTTLVICPGIHEPQLTDRFLQALKQQEILLNTPLIFPTQKYPAFSGFHVLQFLQQELKETNKNSLVFLSFSAGVVGAIAAALAWQASGGRVIAFIALDGWGVPLLGNFPIHRLSHDEFTHWSSALLGSNGDSFYADPPVDHLDLWRSPDFVTGWTTKKNVDGQQTRPTTAIAFLTMLLQRYLGGFSPNVSG